MKTKEKIDYAFSRIKELFLLINSWTCGASKKSCEYEEIKKRKEEIITKEDVTWRSENNNSYMELKNED